MSIVFYDGFDLYNGTSDLARRAWVQGSASIGAFQTGRFSGSRALNVTNGNTSPMILPMTATDTLTVGFAFNAAGVGSFGVNGSDCVLLRNSGSVILRLGITSAGHIRLGRGDYTTNLVCGSASGLITSGAWNYVEVEITRNGATGAATIYLNGVSVATASGVNTGASSINELGIVGGSTTCLYDDFYLTNTATRLGEQRVETIRPSADTAQKDFTPNSGTANFSRVNQTIVDDDTSYVASSTVGHKDLFDMADLVSTPASIKAVQPILIARKDDATLRQTRTNMKNGATTTNGTTRTLGTTYTMYNDIYETNPNTAAPFTGADVNAMQLGYEVVA